MWVRLFTKARQVRHDQVEPLKAFTALTRRHTTNVESGVKPHVIAWNSLRTLGTVLSNSLLSASIAWLLAFCIDQGNVYSALDADLQSYAEFLTAKMVWFWIFCWVFTIAECVAKLLPETFSSGPTPSTLSVTRITVKLVRAMLLHIVQVVIVSVGVAIGISLLPVPYRTWKADVYWPMVCYNLILTVTDAHTRHIFQIETLNGQALATRKRRRSQSRQPGRQTRPRRSPSLAQFGRVFVQNLVLVISGLSAGAFVHITSVIEMKSKWQLFTFAVCTQVLKLGIQGVAKNYLAKRPKTPSLRTMAIIVAAPTILLDSQLRTVLLCLDSKTITIAGSVLLAVGKTILRLAAALHLRRRTREIIRIFPPPQPICPPCGEDLAAGMARPVASLLSGSVSMSSQEWQGIARVQKLMALHAAEVYADMHAEYISMCCAYVVIICFGSDPRFLLGGNASSSSIHTIQITTVLMQIGIEVVVDIVAIPLETHLGVNFEKFHEDDVFLAIFMVLVAVVNTHIASGIYMLPQ